MEILLDSLDKDMDGVFSFEDFKNSIPMINEEVENDLSSEHYHFWSIQLV